MERFGTRLFHFRCRGAITLEHSGTLRIAWNIRMCGGRTCDGLTVRHGSSFSPCAEWRDWHGTKQKTNIPE